VNDVGIYRTGDGVNVLPVQPFQPGDSVYLAADFIEYQRGAAQLLHPHPVEVGPLMSVVVSGIFFRAVAEGVDASAAGSHVAHDFLGDLVFLWIVVRLENER
jgi:hypothetical protein